MLFQPLGQRLRVLRVPLHAQVQSFDSEQEQEGGEGAQNRHQEDATGQRREELAHGGPVFVTQDAEHQGGAADGEKSFIAAARMPAPPML